MIEYIVVYSISALFGIIPCWLWGKRGGDEVYKSPLMCKILKYIHHWELGITTMTWGVLMYLWQIDPLVCCAVIGYGFGTALDDMLFHSFEHYFKREFDEIKALRGR